MTTSGSETARAANDLKKMRRPKTAGAAVDRLPPHALDMEKGVCGCVLMSPGTVMDELQEARLVPEWCYDLRHQLLLHQAFRLHEEGKAWDVLVLQQRLKEAGLLEQVGGLAYLAQLQDAVPSAANLAYYLEAVRQKWQLRELIKLCTLTCGEAMEHTGEVDELLARVHSDFLRLETACVKDSEWSMKRLLADKVIPALTAHYTRGKAQINGITTGIEYLDKIFCGLGQAHGNYHVIAARPNVGKTSFMTQVALHAALAWERWEPVTEEEHARAEAAGERVTKGDDGKCLVLKRGVPVGISSLEMSADSLATKMLFQKGLADLQRWRTGFAEQKDVEVLAGAAAHLAERDNIYIDDSSRLPIEQIKARWRRWHRQYGVRLFMLDYLQLSKTLGKKLRPDRVQELADVSAELQALGKELNCPMIILAQMNRDYEKDPNRAPRMSDLKDCGAVEQDADTVTFLYAPRMSDTNKEFFEQAMEQRFGANWKKWDGRPERINALVAKNKHGPKGKAEMLLLHSSTVFVDWNKWLKENRLKAAAKGEESRYREEGDEEP